MERTKPSVGAINAHALQELQANFHGELILPGDAQYEEARALFNGMIDRYPALIARCATPDDVIQAVNVARNHDLKLAVRGGGHNGGGLGTVEGGLVIDLSLMKEIVVDAAAGTAKVGGG